MKNLPDIIKTLCYFDYESDIQLKNIMSLLVTKNNISITHKQLISDVEIISKDVGNRYSGSSKSEKLIDFEYQIHSSQLKAIVDLLLTVNEKQIDDINKIFISIDKHHKSFIDCTINLTSTIIEKEICFSVYNKTSEIIFETDFVEVENGCISDKTMFEKWKNGELV